MKATRAVLALLLAISSLAPLTAASSAPLIVRLYDTTRLRAPELSAARREAASILGDTGLDVAFRYCGAPLAGELADPCDEPLRRSEVVVRIITAPAFNLNLHPEAYGVTYVVRESNRGWLATVFSDRIDAAAARVRVPPGMLLGRVIAHEVGHLLLGREYHGGAGLMRAEWPDADLAGTEEAWRFSRHEAARMSVVLSSIAF